MAKQDGIQPQAPKPVFWVASSKEDLREFPKGVLKEAEKDHAEWSQQQRQEDPDHD